MDVMHTRVAGLDVHKETVVACVRLTAGRKAVIGRPIMYRTSKDFLMRFGLSDLEELPSLKEFEQLARAALGSDEGIVPAEPEAQTEAADQGVAPATGVSEVAASAEPSPKESTVSAEIEAEQSEHTNAKSAS